MKQICDTKKKFAKLNAAAYFLNIYIYIYIYMSPKLEIHRRHDNHKTYFLHKYHRCPEEVNIIKEGIMQTLFIVLT